MAYTQKKGKYYYVYTTMPPDSDHDAKWVKCHTKHPDTLERWTGKTAAKNWGDEYEREVNKPTWVDPKLGDTTWDELWDWWIGSIDVEPGTERFYKDLWYPHVQPRYGHTPIGRTDRSDVTEWLKQLRAGTVETGTKERRRTQAYSQRTVSGILKMMKLMLEDACDRKPPLLGFNPLEVRISTRRRGRRTAHREMTSRPKLTATPEQVLAAAVNMHQVVGPGSLAGMGAFVRVLTAGWTGIRPGEQAALDRGNCFADATPPRIVVHDDDGSLEELPGEDPRTKAPKSGIGREVLLPMGLAVVLAAWLEYHSDAIVFPGPEGDDDEGHWRRRRWSYRWNQAATGGILTLKGPTRHAEAGEYVLERAVPGLEFKGLRRVHNVWLTELGVPEVARTNRLGHAMSDEMQAAYSQVSKPLEAQLLAGLQELWVAAFAGYAGIAAMSIIRSFAPSFGRASGPVLPSPRAAIAPGGSVVSQASDW